MTCRTISLSIEGSDRTGIAIRKVRAIVCDRGATPPRVHYIEPKAGLAGIVLCGRNDPKHHTQNPAEVTCKKCLDWIRKGVLGDAAARLSARFNASKQEA